MYLIQHSLELTFVWGLWVGILGPFRINFSTHRNINWALRELSFGNFICMLWHCSSWLHHPPLFSSGSSERKVKKQMDLLILTSISNKCKTKSIIKDKNWLSSKTFLKNLKTKPNTLEYSRKTMMTMMINTKSKENATVLMMEVIHSVKMNHQNNFLKSHKKSIKSLNPPKVMGLRTLYYRRVAKRNIELIFHEFL